MQSSLETNLMSGRKYELDWLRVFAILALLFFHTGRIFDTVNWHINNTELSKDFDYWMPFVHTWRMPLLLFISGAGSYFAFKSIFPFLIQRFKRLIIPFIFGMIVMLPPQVYFEHIGEFASFWDAYKSILNFIPFYHGVLNLYHLWFLIYLFIYSLIALPIIVFLHSPYSVVFKAKFLRYFFNPFTLLSIPPVLITITQLIFLPNYTGRAFFVLYFCFFFLGIIFYCSSAYRRTIGKNRKYFLIASLLILIPYLFPLQGTYLLGRIPIGTALEIFIGWFWILAIIAYGQYYLSRSHPWLATIGDGLISFYILHQTVIVVIGYYIIQLPWSISAKFWSINLLTLVFCVTFYLLCIRPFNAMRIVFGMKLKAAPLTLAPAVARQSTS